MLDDLLSPLHCDMVSLVEKTIYTGHVLVRDITVEYFIYCFKCFEHHKLVSL